MAREHAREAKSDAEHVEHVALWEERAKGILERAFGEVGETMEAIATISAAEAALRIAYGELPPDELDPSWYETDEEREARELVDCTCGAERRAAGGFISSCPVHGRGAS